jgi:thioredoxin 1
MTKNDNRLNNNPSVKKNRYYMWRNNMELLTEQNFKTKTSEGYTIIDMYADWCGPCRAMAPILEQYENSNNHNAKVYKINVDIEQKLATQFNVTSIPCMVVLKNGKEIGRIIGAMPLPVFTEEVQKIVTDS